MVGDDGVSEKEAVRGEEVGWEGEDSEGEATSAIILIALQREWMAVAMVLEML